MEHGADPLAPGPNNSSVLHICAERDFIKIAKAIVETDREKYKCLLFYQTSAGDSEDGDESDDEHVGNTPLHTACEWNSMQLVEYFFELGGEPLVRVKNMQGLDAIEYAYAENQDNCYHYLCKKVGQPARWMYCNIF